VQAIILAGGKGTRLKPFTVTIPKPLVPIGDTPILEIVLKQLKKAGFQDIVLSVNHLAEYIRAFFGDGKKNDIRITYYFEEKPLGTAGSLSMIDYLEDNFLVMNGDLLTTINYKDLFNFHINNKNDITISTYKKEVRIDLGVLKIENNCFVDYIEKPTFSYDVSMGIYVLNKKVVNFIPYKEKFDMPDLMLALKRNNMKIGCYSGNYYWLDIGRMEDYEAAIEIFSNKREEFLPL